MRHLDRNDCEVINGHGVSWRRITRSPPAASRSLAGVAVLLGLLAFPPAGVLEQRDHGGSLFSSWQSFDLVYLVNGPNDGEPLGNRTIFHFQSFLQEDMLALLEVNGEFAESFWIPAPFPGTGLHDVVLDVDIGRLPSGSVNLTIRFFATRRGVFVGSYQYRGVVENPKLSIAPLWQVLHNDTLEIALVGRPGDDHYVVTAVTGEACGDSNPETLSTSYYSQTVIARGRFGQSGEKKQIIVLKLDTLFRFHSLGTALVLWTDHPERGWSHSTAVIPLKHDLPGASLDPPEAVPAPFAELGSFRHVK